ncbi:UDP-N-acetylglucosamine--N-acetylmuramyl-(pentapeptide) pyrophosphoryl-undecaprenol N-acetylglucosamine transferase [bioreactor metagenome]|uniref:UDP-N-acetylglucosamine--N-acetylmuramyl-(Pentapeptide) pyrophosphoryl-undecaprenol N-acetylglucosamine transferase n=1 Tax=bioreactor metagenome TaxID=1076179 RepID=A0A645EBC3_9ZZZZ
MPLRPELEKAAAITRNEAIDGLNREFGVALDPALPTVLVFGGSQGASIFNGVLPETLNRLQKNFEFQVLHLSGPGKLGEAKQAYGDTSFPLLLLESSEKMELFLGGADLAVSRSGGSTVAELARFGRASVLIPYPYAAENHQYDNARYLADGGAADLVPNDECTPERLESLLAGLLKDPETLKRRGALASSLAMPAAAGRLLSAISDRLPSALR